MQSEVELLRRPARADFVILRRRRRGRHRARALRRLWRWVRSVALVELKSHVEPLRRGDLSWWLGLVHLLTAIRHHRGQLDPVQAVLVVARRTPTLQAEIRRASLRLGEQRGGYLRLRNAGVDAMIVVLEEVRRAERDSLLALFAGGRVEGSRARRWLAAHGGRVFEAMGSKLAHADQAFVDAFIASLPARRRLAGLAPEQRLAGLAPEQIAEALSALPAAARSRITARLAARSRVAGVHRGRSVERPRPARRSS